MKLFLVEKRDLLGNDDARYIVQATTQDEDFSVKNKY